VTNFTIKGNSILQTSTLKIVLEYAHSFEQYSTRVLIPSMTIIYITCGLCLVPSSRHSSSLIMDVRRTCVICYTLSHKYRWLFIFLCVTSIFCTVCLYLLVHASCPEPWWCVDKLHSFACHLAHYLPDGG